MRTIPYGTLLPLKRTQPMKFSCGEEVMLYESEQYKAWSRLYTTINSTTGGKRKHGSDLIFERFFNQMMPINICFAWFEEKPPNHLFRIIEKGKTREEDRELFHAKGTKKHIFQKLFEHYGKYRSTYFQARYHTKFIKTPLIDTLKKGLNPPKPEIIEKEVEVQVEVIKEVPIEVPVEIPGKTVDYLEQALGVLQIEAMNALDGNKKLPNKYRRVKNIEALTKGDGFIHLHIKMGS